mmetsp:Transcript_14813/g.23501  ORF Transcript_14813/g.23501 Transcript_14813/m.23501 type:complete len:303 (-) Transcript_14813:88-996(-)|eukprot:jgi/Bigna1/88703/estExt_fgenesh1_pg.C_370008
MMCLKFILFSLILLSIREVTGSSSTSSRLRSIYEYSGRIATDEDDGSSSYNGNNGFGQKAATTFDESSKPTTSNQPKLIKESFYGTAYRNEKESEVLYTEKHSVLFDALSGKPLESFVEYISPPQQGPCQQIFAHMKSDFTRGYNISEYMFHHIPLKWKEGVQYDQGRYVMFQGENNILETKELPVDKSALFAGQGYHYHILEKLDELAESTKPQMIHLAFPAHLTAYPFALKREWKRGDLLKLSMSFDSWFISYFAPKIYLTYDIRRRRLVSFTGPSHVYDDNGKLQNVHVTYKQSHATLG